jgi:pilus assembly protein Flp/PilA
MNTIRRCNAASLQRFLADERGATAIEYAMIAGGIAVAVAATVMALGTSVNAMFESVKSAWPT